VYYDAAIRYLSNNDPSLRNSVELAADLGYNLKDLDSCTLANILCQEEQREDLAEVNFEELFALINR
jgi:hypothetical protein